MIVKEFVSLIVAAMETGKRIIFIVKVSIRKEYFVKNTNPIDAN